MKSFRARARCHWRMLATLVVQFFVLPWVWEIALLACAPWLWRGVPADKCRQHVVRYAEWTQNVGLCLLSHTLLTDADDFSAPLSRLCFWCAFGIGLAVFYWDAVTAFAMLPFLPVAEERVMFPMAFHRRSLTTVWRCAGASAALNVLHAAAREALSSACLRLARQQEGGVRALVHGDHPECACPLSAWSWSASVIPWLVGGVYMVT